jgi:hypothetical protein
MEIVDNAFLPLWPGAMDAYPHDALFRISLANALAVAWGLTFLVNRPLIKRGKGHASRTTRTAPPTEGSRPRD